MAGTWTTALAGSNVACPRKGTQAAAMPNAPYRIPATAATAAAMTVLASCMRCLTGTHSSEARTLFVAYSLVTAVIARTTIANCTSSSAVTGALPTGWSGTSLMRAIEPW
ncbi:hypothetical protein ABT246_24010 [Streptomyces sp. NPDC001553]|uniref:hypothetical protein n=1 Tax=Streptomyces sp. NPDC001553 TaxID=3154385 RepID=UPI0033226685